jgi:hypothetical protein
VTNELLIDAIVRQTTVLIAQLATANGVRTPIADLAEQVFAELVRELERQGVSRKVAADMFGMALRTFRWRVQRLSESRTVADRSLWEAVHAYVGEHEVVLQSEVLRRFHRDDEELVRGVLHDLVESGLVFRTGKGAGARFRSARGSDLAHDDDAARGEATDALIAAIVYRFGPLDRAGVRRAVNVPDSVLEPSVARLVSSGQVVQLETDIGKLLRAPDLVRPIGTPAGWEAAVFDHFQALVGTICAKLRLDPDGPARGDVIGGSTYTFEVWRGHPHEHEAMGELAALRQRLSALRTKIAAANEGRPIPERRVQVVVYCGQNVIEVGDEEESGSRSPAVGGAPRSTHGRAREARWIPGSTRARRRRIHH